MTGSLSDGGTRVTTTRTGQPLACVVINPSKPRATAAVRGLLERELREAGYADPVWLETSVSEPGAMQARLALAAGVEAEAVVEALASARLESPHRMDVRELELTGPNGHNLGILLIDDSYNANIDSMTASLAALPILAGQRRRVVLVSEMLELGPASEADHRRTGELVAAAGAALLLTIGRGAAPAAQAARAADVKTLQVADADAALDLLGSEHSPLRDGDAVLVKGSHDSGAWRLADFLVERSKEGTQR